MKECDVSEIEIDGEIDGEESEPETFSKKKVLTQSDKPSISDLVRRIKKGRIDLHPDFQREYVWDRGKASRLIESILMNIPLPIIYLAEEPNGMVSVIDGQQRLRSLYSFVQGEFPLTGLKCYKELNGCKYDQLDEEIQDAIEEYGISIITFSKDGDQDLKFNVFERLNTGAVALNDQELRNCVYRGRYNELLKELARDKDFQSLLGLNGAERRMRDVEFVLRFAAFHHATYLNYKSPIKRFLNDDMQKYRMLNEKDADELRQVFKTAVSLIKSLLGDKAFKRFYPGKEAAQDGRWETKKFNASLYDVLMWSFARADKNQVMNNLDAIREAYIDLMTSDAEFITAIERSTSNVPMVRQRFKKWEDRLEQVLANTKKQPRCFSRELKERLYKANPTCAICGQRISSLDDAAVDHIKQYWAGGETIEGNARLAHRYCNCARPKNDVVAQ